jgi:SAM-dependent methyltransferase
MRKHWKIKGVLQRVLSRAPGGAAVNDLLQRVSGDLRDFEGYIGRKVRDFQFYAERVRERRGSLRGLEIVEVGTGWLPLLPALFSASGARTIHTYDQTRHLNEALTRRALKAAAAHADMVSEWTGTEAGEIARRLRELAGAATGREMFEGAGIRYHAPGDAAVTGLAAASVDVVFSNSVLEHIPGEVIGAIFRESRRVLKADGMAVHGVNCGDHYAYFDRGITQINYLQYSAAEWKKWNHAMLYQNRLRPRDFERLAGEAGLVMVFERRSARAGCAEAFERMKVAEEFRSYSREDLVCTSFDFVAAPGGEA